MRVQDIQINYLYFQFMSKKETEIPERIGSTAEFDENVHRVYAGYVTKIANQSPSHHSYDLYEVTDDFQLKTKQTLESFQRMNIPDQVTEFNELAGKLAQKYIEIDKSPIAGVFFVVLLTCDGKRYLSILKLDWVSESWTEFDEKTRKMTLKEILQALPGDKRFRKGSIFPHPIEPKRKYMKVYQDDNPADYFDKFLAGSQKMTAFDVMKDMRKAVHKLSGDWPDIDEQLGLYDGLEACATSKKSIDPITVTGIVKSAVPTHASKVKETIEKQWVLSGEVDSSEVEDLLMEFMIGKLKLRGPMSEFRKRFEFNVGGNHEKHRINGRIEDVRHRKK